MNRLSNLGSEIGKIQLPQIEISNTETPITTPATETAGWKTYTNSEYGFEIKYPKDYFKNINMKEGIAEDSIFGKYTYLLKSDDYDGTNSIYIPYFYINYFPFSPEKYQEINIKQNRVEQPKTTFKSLAVDGVEAYYTDGVTLTVGAGCEYKETIIPVGSGTVELIFAKCSDNNYNNILTEKENELSNQIVSTFKFAPVK